MFSHCDTSLDSLQIEICQWLISLRVVFGTVPRNFLLPYPLPLYCPQSPQMSYSRTANGLDSHSFVDSFSPIPIPHTHRLTDWLSDCRSPDGPPPSHQMPANVPRTTLANVEARGLPFESMNYEVNRLSDRQNLFILSPLLQSSTPINFRMIDMGGIE